MKLHLFDPKNSRLIKSDGTEIPFGDLITGKAPDAEDLMETVREIALNRSWIGPHDEIGVFA